MPAAFRPLFERSARRVRARLALRHVVGGAALGLLAGAVGSAALWRTGHGAARPLGAIVGVLGAAAGLELARRRRWADGDVALYLDARLDAHEAIVTAVELEQRSACDDGPRAVVLGQAALVLERATPDDARPPVARPWHLTLPVAAAAIAALSVAPLPPPPPAPSAPPGTERVRLAEVLGLETVAKLAELAPRDEAQRQRLKSLADEARRLRDRLRDGAEKREAEAEIGKLEDGISAERLSLGDGEQRQGMESALGKLGDDPDLARAQRALGDRDLVRLDDEMERLADTLERADRERAQRTLADAADAARRAGAPGVAKALEAERSRLAQKGLARDRLRALAKELGDALGDDDKRALDDLAMPGRGQDEREVARHLEAALGKLTPEQRKRLVENLKKRLRATRGASPTEPPTSELPRRDEELDEKQLADELRKLADAPPEGSEEAERQRSLDGAQEGAGDAKREVSGLPLPMAGREPGKEGKEGRGGADDRAGPVGGTGRGGGEGTHVGATGAVEGGDVRARATGRMNAGRPMPGVVMGRTSARPGDTANLRGLGALGAAAPSEIGGVERGDVPEEYRAQVGRYFQVK